MQNQGTTSLIGLAPINDHGMHADFRGSCRVRKVVIVLVDGKFHKFCVIFMALGIHEETTGGDRLDTVGNSADEESEKSENLHGMNVGGKRFNF